MTTTITVQGNVTAEVQHYDSFFTITFSVDGSDTKIFFDKTRLVGQGKYNDIAAACEALTHTINQ